MRLVGGEEGHRAAAILGHARHGGVGGVQHGHAAVGHVLHDHSFEYREVFHGGDVVQSQVIPGADIRHHGDLAAVEGQAFAQHAAARRLEHGRVHVRVQQHVARAARAAAVAAVDLAPFDVHAIGVGHAGAQAGSRQQMGDQAHGGGLAIGAGDGDDGDAAIVALGEHGGDDGFAHGAWLAERRRQVHAQARCGVHFDDAGVLLFQRFQNAFGDHVHAADVQAHHVRGGDGARRHFRVHVDGDVGGRAARRQVGVIAQNYALAHGRHGFGHIALLGQAGQGDVVEADFRQRGGVAAAAARVQVDLVDQFAHRVLAVAHHLRRVAAGRCHHLVADDEQTEIVARQIAFDEDVVAEFLRREEGGRQLFARGDVDGDALALVAIFRFHDDGQADLAGGGPGVVRVDGDTAVRHRHAGRIEQLLGQFLVLRDGFGNGAGAVHFGGLDLALLAAPAERHQAAFGQAAERDVARHGGVDDGAGRWTEAHVFIEFLQLVQGAGQVERRIVERGAAQLLRQFQGQAADGFFRVFDDDLEDARFQGRRGAAEGDGAAGLRLQAQRRQFQHLRHRRGVVIAQRLQRAQLRKARAQAGFEAGQLGDVEFLRGAGNNGFHGGVVAPEVRAPQGPYARYFHN